MKYDRIVYKQISKAQQYKVRKLALKSEGRQIRRKIKHFGSKQCFKSFEELTIVWNDPLPTCFNSDYCL